MNPRKCIESAEKHRTAMEKAIAPLNKKLAEFFDDYNCSVFCQLGDGWCVLFDHDRNAPVSEIDFNLLFSLSRNDAIKYLRERDI